MRAFERSRKPQVGNSVKLVEVADDCSAICGRSTSGQPCAIGGLQNLTSVLHHVYLDKDMR